MNLNWTSEIYYVWIFGCKREHERVLQQTSLQFKSVQMTTAAQVMELFPTQALRQDRPWGHSHSCCGSPGGMNWSEGMKWGQLGHTPVLWPQMGGKGSAEHRGSNARDLTQNWRRYE
jgi:hypothetical protein